MGDAARAGQSARTRGTTHRRPQHEQGRHLLENRGLDASRLPVMIRHDGYTMVEPTAAQIIEAMGGSAHSDVDETDTSIQGVGSKGRRRQSALGRRWCRLV